MFLCKIEIEAKLTNKIPKAPEFSLKVILAQVIHMIFSYKIK